MTTVLAGPYVCHVRVKRADHPIAALCGTLRPVDNLCTSIPSSRRAGILERVAWLPRVNGPSHMHALVLRPPFADLRLRVDLPH